MGRLSRDQPDHQDLITCSGSNALHVESARIVGRIERHEHLGDRRADPVPDLAQRGEVEAVDAGRGRLDHRLRLGGRARRERGAQRFGRVRIAAFGVRIVGAPHDPVDADLVAQHALRRAEEARADPEVALEVLARA